MKKIFIYAFAGLLLVGGAGCDKLEDFGNTNVNPSATTDANVGALLSNTLSGLPGYSFDSRPGYYAQYFSETQYPDASIYSLPQLSFTGNYSGALYDLQNIINENKSNNQNVIAKIVQQYIFWNMTDRWGDVPYSQALKGVTVTQPIYDKQEDIYKGMIAALTSAVSSFDGSAVTGDIIYNGDAASWKRLCNSMRMLMSVQLSKRYPGASEYAATQFKLALNDANGSISTNAQNFKLSISAGFKSAYWSTYNGRKDLAESKTMTDLMGTTLGSDPRQSAFGGASEVAGNTASSSVGVPYGVDRATATAFTDANLTWARVLRGDLRSELSPVFIITAAESWLARAEAANLGWTTETLTTTYNQGITLSFEQWGVGTPSAGYLAQTNVVLGAVGAANNVKNIAIQRYVASYPDGWQAWNIWRKSGFPVLSPAPAAAVGKQIVRRYTYAASEYTSNKTNVTAAVARIPGGVDSQDARVWWDQ
jgi:hypothetical protein